MQPTRLERQLIDIAALTKLCVDSSQRAVVWATDALAHDDTTVSALARHLRVDWHTLWRAVSGLAPAPLASKFA